MGVGNSRPELDAAALMDMVGDGTRATLTPAKLSSLLGKIERGDASQSGVVVRGTTPPVSLMTVCAVDVEDPESAAALTEGLVASGAPPLVYTVDGVPLAFAAWRARHFAASLALLGGAIAAVSATPSGCDASARHVKDPDGNTFFHLVALEDRVVIAPLLAQIEAVVEGLITTCGAVLSDKNSAAVPPLYAAYAAFGHDATFRILLDVGLRHRDKASSHVEGGHLLDASGSSDGSCLLHLAAQAGDAELVSLLVDAGACLDPTTAHGVTPLELAARAGADDVVQILVDAAVAAGIDVGLGARALDGSSLVGHPLVHAALAEPQAARLAADDARLASDSGGSSDNVLSIQLVSDVHTEFLAEDTAWGSVLERKAPVLALLGDIGLAIDAKYGAFVAAQAEVFDTVLLLAGNHLFYRAVSAQVAMARAVAVADAHPNVHLLHDSFVDLMGRFRVVGGILWGCVPDANIDIVQMRMNDYRRIRTADPDARSLVPAEPGALAEDPAGDRAPDRDPEPAPLLTVAQTNVWHATTVAYIRDTVTDAVAAGLTPIVLTHHAPTVTPGYSKIDFAGSNLTSAMGTNQSELIGTGHIALWAYGHTHWFFDRTAPSGTRVVSHPKGYPHDHLPWHVDGYVVHVPSVAAASSASAASAASSASAASDASVASEPAASAASA